jgi:YhcH/YjgK/YiaL family protein
MRQGLPDCQINNSTVYLPDRLQSVVTDLKIVHHLKNCTMILDKLENADIYSGISENLKKGFDFLKNTDLSKIEIGRYEMDGKNVFALVSEYDTKKPEDCRLEAHQIYADIQYIVSGKEAIGFATLNGQIVTAEYNPEKDIAFFSGETIPLVLNAGMFAVFFPQDTHRPCMQVDGPEKVKKVVMKVRL